ncbi:MAG TPA: hypothetical protein VI488_16440, partial [Candidatus Angelobacter sp.]
MNTYASFRSSAPRMALISPVAVSPQKRRPARFRQPVHKRPQLRLRVGRGALVARLHLYLQHH